MRLAIGLAKKGVGKTSPNPAVGAVIVKDGRVVSKGWHKKAGGAHAEASALSKKTLNAGGYSPLAGAALYVTLEPCRHYGNTPPCTEAIIRAGIKRVFLGTRDPNPLVSGKGIKALKRAGIEVVGGVLERECRGLNPAFNKFIVSKMPHVTLKLAATLDGKIATSKGESRWITGVASRRYVHRLRAITDAVITSGKTVISDDPELTVRHAHGLNPMRVVLDSAFKTPLDSKVFRRYPGDRDGRLPMVFISASAAKKKIEKAKGLGINVAAATKAVGGSGVDLKSVLKTLGNMGVTSVMVEGGGVLTASFLKDRLVDRLFWFVSPKILGADAAASVGELKIKKLGAAIEIKNIKVKKIGNDVLIEGEF
ncbi:MAG: bifunctional diaminohydroxyphosphoribosylaminopyrimidine deaminase/5-amino-6-(5-phosphoribosylamino)uracil reductase RibD [Deltaproteobacteria bacterium]|nr:bifunctional diaminohydroxyphosphoribosylaminopyrimidine deaminase/5-amino-6-(5-phosphoribosylamino)uracil reductase RibD [Deltaproteobacteria bacterium]